MQTATKGRKTQDILKKKQIEAIRETLTSERERILNMYKNDLRAGAESTAEGGEDIVDRANTAYNREFLLTIGDTEREQLRLIDEAITRLDDNTYGFCLHSGEPIALPRLEAVPWARYTVDVQEKIERGLLLEEDA